MTEKSLEKKCTESSRSKKRDLIEENMETTNRAVPTGCYKCGRPGHWSRDCPFDPSSNPNPTPNSAATNTYSSSSSSKVAPPAGPAKGNFGPKPEKPKKLPRTRPKLTPELLLSDDGIGYVLRYFPRHFKYRGRGNEIRDLGHLLGMYKEWNNHLIPYYSFDQFVQKVEKVAASKQVKRCIRELRDRVANGGDPTKLHEPPTENNLPVNVQETGNVEESNQNEKDPFSKNSNDDDDIPEDMFSEMFVQATHQEEPFESLQNDMVADAMPTVKDAHNPSSSKDENSNESAESIRISEEQKARMEANRLKALEKAASRARLSLANN